MCQGLDFWSGGSGLDSQNILDIQITLSESEILVCWFNFENRKRRILPGPGFEPVYTVSKYLPRYIWKFVISLYSGLTKSHK